MDENFVEIRELVADREFGLDLKSIGSPEGLGEKICDARVHKLGLALTGIEVPLHPDRVQIVGQTEKTYLKSLTPARQSEIACMLRDHRIRCIVITRNQRFPREFSAPLEKAGIALLRTPHQSEIFIERVAAFLEERLAPRHSIHGVLVDVLGVGVLIIGAGGIGKSECALDLVQRGHRLVADDLVDMIRYGKTVIGRSSPVIKHHMEIRGLGIINIQDLFGIAAVRDRKRVEMIIELVEWKAGIRIDSLGLDDEEYEILGIPLPHVKLPVLPGKNLSVIVEVAARNHLLKLKGHYSAREFQKKLIRQIAATGRVIPFVKEEVE